MSKTKKTVSTGQSKSSSAISPENRAKSADFVDSASAYNEDYEMAISFFKLAISFNKYNYRAWYGLVNTYHSMNELDKEKKAKDEMEMLFGKNVFDFTCVLLTIAMGLLGGGRIIGIGLGTLCSMLFTGRVIALCTAPVLKAYNLVTK